MFKSRLFTPGPTPVPEIVQLEMAKPMIHHRHPEFGEIFQRANENLKYVFQTSQTVWTMTSSGTGVLEAAVVNLFSAGDEIIFVNAGKFGERWGNICKTYGLKTNEIKIPWGEAVQPEHLKNALKEFPNVKAVLLTHNETSTGTTINLKELAATIRNNSNALVCVDGISSIGAIEMRMDEWGIDCALSGSQKGFMVPPGLAFIALSERAWKFTETSTLPKFYFSLKKCVKSYKDLETPWTPAITIFIGLDKALQMMKAEGMENVWKRHTRMANATRIGCQAIGLQLYSKSPSNSMTAAWIPENIRNDVALNKKFNSTLKKTFGITVAGGQDELQGKIFRISHLGYYDEFDILSCIAALERSLAEVGFQFEMGSGVKAAQESFVK
jgi:aspartate aminotransferase-like enzyme